MAELADSVVLVTGAKGGLGTHVTRAFLDAGALVVGTSRTITDADFPHQRFAGIPADLTDPAAAVHILRAVLPSMRTAKSGRIIAIGSRAGLEPPANIAAYSASKAALVSLVRTAALENRDLGITANVILPGTIDTPANRQSDPWGDRLKWVAPERLAALAVFLASDAGAQITGTAIPVYGTAAWVPAAESRGGA